ncbi:transglycosylase domain-containing protein [Promicromonospora sp. NPDC023805]|uniref:transglycosylase domain-containing protein n=1 Tax=Promicromonospora sp. NPDC023805 TaxID=3154696 RepID=UPI003405B7DF
MGTFLTGTSLVAGVLVAGWFGWEVPEENPDVGSQTTTVYYSDGTPIGKFAAQDRTIVPLSELPPYIGQAVISSEDSKFESHLGIDPLGIVRAAVNNFTGGARQGASTLTQQYVENTYYEAGQSTYADKLRELVLALKVDRDKTKDQILEGYLNTIYLGRGAYGVEAASKAYFGHPATEITASEAAFLAGIVPNPTYWDPRQGEVAQKQAEIRWTRTLNLMLENGYITKEERTSAQFPKLQEYKQGSGDSRTAYLLEQVARELAQTGPGAAGISEDQLTKAGYEIHTSIDRKMQAAAYKTMELPEDAGKFTRASLTSIDPQTGEIKAMYGGPNYSEYPTNAATFRAQGASTFKPFTLIGALREGIPLTEKYDSTDGMTIEGWKLDPDGPDVPLSNFDNKSYGWIDLADATAQSVNVVYGQLNKEIGPDKTAQAAYDLGIPRPDDNDETNDCCVIRNNLANVLGTDYVTNVDLAHAYSTIAAQGYRTTPHLVTKVTRGETTVDEGDTTRQKVFEPDVMAATTYALEKVVEEGSGAEAQNLVGPDGVTQRPAAGKTGSSQATESAWFAGFVPQLTTVVGLYQYDTDKNAYEQVQPFGGYEWMTGGSWPAKAWTAYMNEATAGMEIEQFPEYEPPAPEPSPSPSSSPSPSQSEEPEVEMVVVPDNLVGQQYPNAASALAGLNLVPAQVEVDSDQESGTVLEVAQAGQEVEVGTTIQVQVSNGSAFEEETTTVPWGLVNQDQGSAEGQLEAAELTPVIQEQASDTVPEGRVISVDPGEGSEVPLGSEVTLVVSTGPEEGGGDPSGDPSDGGIFG